LLLPHNGKSRIDLLRGHLVFIYPVARPAHEGSLHTRAAAHIGWQVLAQ
jgi:hypothetical protein